MSFSKHKKSLVPIILVLSSFVILTLKVTGHFPSRFFPLLISPFQKAASFFSYSRSGNEEEKLKNQINFLKAQITELKEEEQENRRLREILVFKERKSLKKLLGESAGAKVIGRDPTGWYQMIIIDKGGSEGLRKGMPVITAAGIVGYISETSRNSSQVRLILDGSVSVGALVQRSRETGVVRGKDLNACEMDYLSREADIRPGDLIVSSGLGGMYPAGLVIGRVLSVQKDAYLQTAEILPAVDFSRLEEVLVLKDF